MAVVAAIAYLHEKKGAAVPKETARLNKPD